MKLPPQQQDEPEWLQIQRRHHNEESNWNYGGWAATMLSAVPYAMAEALLRAPNSGVFAFTGLFIAATLTAAAFIITRRSAKGTFRRGFAAWSVAAHGTAAAIFLVVALW